VTCGKKGTQGTFQLRIAGRKTSTGNPSGLAGT